MNLADLQEERQTILRQIEANQQQGLNLKADLSAVDRLIERHAVTSGSDSAAVVDLAPTIRLRQTTLRLPRPPAQSASEVVKKLTQKIMVQKAIDALEGNFTKSSVHAKLREIYPNSLMNEQDVSSALWRMANQSNQLVIVSQGSGGSASVYAKKQSA